MTREEKARYERRLLELGAEAQAVKEELLDRPDASTIPFGPELEEWVTKLEAAIEVASRRFKVIKAEMKIIEEAVKCSSKI